MRIVQQVQPQIAQPQPQPQQQQSLFTSLKAPTFQPQPQQPASNPFAQIASTTSPFGQFASNPNAIQQNIVYQPQTGLQFPSNGLFSQLGSQQTTSSQAFMDLNFSSNSNSASSANLQPGPSYSAYSAMDELNGEEMNEFKSDEFTMGRIPSRPPPRELC